MAGRSQRDREDLILLENGIALADQAEWLLSIVQLRDSQAINRDEDIAGGGLRLALLLGPNITAIRGIVRELERLRENYLEIHNAIRDRRFNVK